MLKCTNQIGGGNCSLCGSPGTNKSTCPKNLKAAKPNPTKHPLAADKPVQPSPKVVAKTVKPAKPEKKIGLVDILRQYFREFQEVRDRHRAHGAADSGLSEALLELITHMKDGPANTPKYWKNYLYDNSPAVVAKELQAAAKNIIELVPLTRLSNDEVEELFYNPVQPPPASPPAAKPTAVRQKTTFANQLVKLVQRINKKLEAAMSMEDGAYESSTGNSITSSVYDGIVDLHKKHPDTSDFMANLDEYMAENNLGLYPDDDLTDDIPTAELKAIMEENKVMTEFLVAIEKLHNKYKH